MSIYFPHLQTPIVTFSIQFPLRVPKGLSTTDLPYHRSFSYRLDTAPTVKHVLTKITRATFNYTLVLLTFYFRLRHERERERYIHVSTGSCLRVQGLYSGDFITRITIKSKSLDTETRTEQTAVEKSSRALERAKKPRTVYRGSP